MRSTFARSQHSNFLMFKFLRHSNKLPFLHDQLFRLQWNIPRCSWILIHYRNSQRKPWYKRTERPYRFKRWFLRGPKGTFSNIANIDAPRITVYIFRYYLCFPQKVVIPLRVGRMEIREGRLTTMIPEMFFQTGSLHLREAELPDLKASLRLTSRNMQVLTPELNLQFSEPKLHTECNWPVSTWIEQRVLSPDNLHLLQHPENLPFHA